LPWATAKKGPEKGWLLPLVLLLAAGSGLAALIYEIVWFQLLELALGSTAVSLATLLATFMGGMCLGSLILPRLVFPRRNSLRIYAAIELGIGVLGILVLLWMPSVGRFPAAISLLPPTLLMGATLPALARQIRSTPGLGLLYVSNIAGGVVGCLISGFYLLRNYDVAVATYVAVGINLAIAGIALWGGHSCLQPAFQPAQSRLTEPRPQGRGFIYTVIALSGLSALAAEVIWTRLLGLLFGASVYTLSIILAVFLVGLGLGSAAGAWLSGNLPRPRLALAWCQFLAAGAIAWAGFSMDAWLPYWPIDPSISSSIWFNFQLDFARALWAVLPAALLWGASFPLALAAGESKNGDASKLMADVYAANTVGAIVGALVASLLLVSWLGSQRAQQVLIGVSIVSGLLALPRRRFIALPALLAGGLLIYAIPRLAKTAIAYGRYAASWTGKGDVIYTGEGRNSFVAVSSFPNGARTFHVAGKIQASNVPRDIRLQRMLGHLTTLTVTQPGSILVIGCGAGITAGAVSIDPRVEHEAIVEIEPLVPHAASVYFRDANFDVLHNPKVQVRIDDGRHFLLTTQERFDGITVDPLDPWVKGAANLYTKEFLEAMKQRLNPGGSVTMYIQLFQTNVEAVKSSVITFFEVFPNATVWGNPYQGRGHDMVLMGKVEPLRIDLDEMERRFGYRDERNMIPQSLAEIGIDSPLDLFATYAGRKSDFTEWLRGTAINRDRNLRMQYLAGLGLNRDDSAAIYSGLLMYRRFPDDIFFSTEGRVDSLRRVIQQQQ
jgi:spermidine synthase